MEEHPMPAGYVVRHAVPNDLDAVAAAMIEFDIVDFGQPDLGKSFVETMWARPGFVVERDAYVVEKDDAVVAYGDLRDPSVPGLIDSTGVVVPQHWGQGVAAALVTLLERDAVARTDGTGRLQHWASSTDTRAAELLRRKGFEVVRHFWHMEKDLSGADHDLPDPPEGILIRAMEPGRDERAVHETLAMALSEHWNADSRTFDEWSQENLQPRGFDPDLWSVAVAGHKMVGAVTATVEEADGHGWINEVGVLRGWRGHGIAAALLRRTFSQIQRRGASQARLSVDAQNETGAVALYERVGMRVRRRWDIYEKDLTTL